jgi:hypothetical protein
LDCESRKDSTASFSSREMKVPRRSASTRSRLYSGLGSLTLWVVPCTFRRVAQSGKRCQVVFKGWCDNRTEIWRGRARRSLRRKVSRPRSVVRCGLIHLQVTTSVLLAGAWDTLYKRSSYSHEAIPCFYRLILVRLLKIHVLCWNRRCGENEEYDRWEDVTLRWAWERQSRPRIPLPE